MTPEKERRLWDVLKEQSNNEYGHTIRIAQIGMSQIGGLGMQEVKDTVRSWDNRGLAMEFEGGTRAMLTPEGVNTDDPT